MVRLYLLGNKALRVIQILEGERLMLISEVIIGKDIAIQKDYFDEIKHECKRKGIQTFDRNSIPREEPSYAIAVGWRWIINYSKRLIILHDSILPKYRGFNPLVTALINGDTTIGATALFANNEYDKGPIIAQKKIEVNYPIKIVEAISLISNLCAKLTIEALDLINKNYLVSQQQDENEVTYSLWRDEQDYIIDWSKDAYFIKRFIDAVGFPYKGAKTYYNKLSVRILDAEVLPDINVENRSPGKVIFKKDNIYTIVCGKGLLKVSEFYNDTLCEEIKFNNFRLRFYS